MPSDEFTVKSKAKIEVVYDTKAAEKEAENAINNLGNDVQKKLENKFKNTKTDVDIGLDFKNLEEIDISKFETQLASLNKSISQMGEGTAKAKLQEVSTELSDLITKMREANGTNLNDLTSSISEFQTKMTSATNEVKQYKATVADAISGLTTNNYSSTLDSLQSTLSLFDGFDSGQISQLKEFASEYKNLYQTLSSSYNADTGKFILSDEEVQKIVSRLNEIQKSFNNTVKSIKSDMNSSNISKALDISSFQTQVNKITQQIESLGKTGVTSSLSSLSTEIKSVMSEAETAWNTGNVDAYNSKIEELKKLLSDAKVQLADLGNTNTSSGANSISSFISSLSSGWQSLTKIIGTGFITREIRSAAKEMVSTVKEIDSSMAQLQIVTGATDSEMNEFLESSISLAKELGQSVSDVLDTVQTYSRLGYGLSDASELAEYSSILSNVAGVDIDDATSGLTSVVKGFDLEVSDVEHVSDVLIEVGQNYAVSASEILEAFEKSSAALAATGATFEESAAIIAAGNAAVQDASTVGTALKTKNCLYVQKCA